MYKVLIVEDDPMVAMINRKYVSENARFQVVQVCRDGECAFTYLREHGADLVILDVFMPRTDGMELLRRLRRERIPAEVIMVTAANDSATLDEALRLGIIDYLVKPFTNNRFQAALNRFLAHRNAFYEFSSLNQQNIDFIIDSLHHRSGVSPKGIQDKTLTLICECLSKAGGRELTSEEIAREVGLSCVTVRRYMNHLLERGGISGRMNYETGGRPSMVYRLPPDMPE